MSAALSSCLGHPSLLLCGGFLGYQKPRAWAALGPDLWEEVLGPADVAPERREMRFQQRAALGWRTDVVGWLPKSFLMPYQLLAMTSELPCQDAIVLLLEVISCIFRCEDVILMYYYF